MRENIEIYKIDIHKNHPLYSTAKRKVVGKMKDQSVGTAIAECACLRPKMYSIMKAGVRCEEKIMHEN